MRYVCDTNVLLENTDILNTNEIVITSDILRELEKHKSQYKDNELAYRARVAVRAIRDSKNVIKIDLKDYEWDLNDEFDKNYVDNKIIKCCIDNKFGLITNDVLLQFKAEMYDIPLLDVSKGEMYEGYTGYKEVEFTDEELAYLYENLHDNKYNLLINQYLIVKDAFGVEVDVLKWDGSRLKELKLPPRKVLDPKNVQQKCAIDLLHDTNVPIKIIAGTYGSGKTFLNVKMALHHTLEKGYHSKIMVIRNPLGSGEAIGYLKGTKDDKTQDFFKPFVQHLEGGEQEAFYLEQRGQLVKEIPYYIKGLSIDESFVIVDESEDLDVKLFKLIGTRLGKNSVIAFSGDFKQAENKFKNNNGLKQAIDKLQGNPLVGIVVLDEDVRSEASKVFADM